MIRACQNCRYGLRAKIQVEETWHPVVECRALPPSVRVSEAGVLSHHSPVMTPAGWCGQFKLSVWKLLSRSDG